MPAAALTQHDLIAHEHFLRDIFSRFLAFKTHSLYFPKSADDTMATGFGPDFDRRGGFDPGGTCLAEAADRCGVAGEFPVQRFYP